MIFHVLCVAYIDICGRAICASLGGDRLRMLFGRLGFRYIVGVAGPILTMRKRRVQRRGGE
jgi:hypothetical protein